MSSLIPATATKCPIDSVRFFTSAALTVTSLMGWHGWGFPDFVARRDGGDAALGARPAGADVGVRIYYVPRQGATEHPRIRLAHKRFWQDYFAAFGGTGLAFHDQPPMSAVAAERLMSLSTQAEITARHQEQLRAEREDTEHLLRRLQVERARLEEVRRRTAATNEEQRRDRQADGTERNSTADGSRAP